MTLRPGFHPAWNVARRTWAAGLAAAVLAAAPAAGRAEGLSVGAEIAMARPFGDSASGATLSSELRYALPLVLELGWSFQGPYALSVYGQYAPGPVSGLAPGGSAACTDYGSSCSRGRWTAVGVRVEKTDGRVGPARLRAGLGVGYEWLGYDVRGPAGPGTLDWKGLQAGIRLAADWEVTRQLSVGPSFDVTVGRFDKISLSQGGQTAGASIGSKSVHGWIGVGFQGRFEPG